MGFFLGKSIGRKYTKRGRPPHCCFRDLLRTSKRSSRPLYPWETRTECPHGISGSRVWLKSFSLASAVVVFHALSQCISALTRVRESINLKTDILIASVRILFLLYPFNRDLIIYKIILGHRFLGSWCSRAHFVQFTPTSFFAGLLMSMLVCPFSTPSYKGRYF